MAILSINELKNLVEQPKGYCVSIYLPTHIAGPEIRQDPIRFKNLMRDAEEQLTKLGMRATDAAKLLDRVKDLDAPEFWRHQQEGLAIFVSENFFRYYRLPLDFEELVVVDGHFHLKPLMPLLTGDGRFFILALSKNQVRLLEGTRDRIREFDVNNVEEVPESLREAILQYEDTAKQTDFEAVEAASPSGLPGSNPGTLHGRGVDEDMESKLRQFFSHLDKGLQEFLAEQQSPLVLAGVEKNVAKYRKINSYQHLLEEYLEGNFDIAKPEELHNQAWEIVHPYFEQLQSEKAEQFAEFNGNNPEQVSEDVKEIVKAAFYQKIDSLFVTVDSHSWGSFHPQDLSIELHEEQKPGDEDLLDYAAIQTVINGGTVFAVPEDSVPSDTPIAAVFRY